MAFWKKLFGSESTDKKLIDAADIGDITDRWKGNDKEYLDTICYAVHDYFQVEPKLVRCPQCSGKLHFQDVDNSKFSRFFSESALIGGVDTFLIRCSKCEWWAIREMRTDFEAPGGDKDYIVMVCPPKFSASPEHLAPILKDDPAPWYQILYNDEYCLDSDNHSDHQPCSNVVVLYG